jgi:hypothetical protein
MMLRVPGREQRYPLSLGHTLEVGDLGETRRRRFLEQAMKTSAYAFARDLEPRSWRRSDRDCLETFDAPDQLAPVREGLRHALARPAGRRCEFKPGVALNRRDVLVGSDLPEADDRDPDRRHARTRAT